MPAQKNWVPKGRHERRNADFGDDDFVEEPDENSRGEACEDRDPAEVVFLEQNRKDEAGKGDDRRKAEVDFARADHKGEPGGEKDQRREGGEEGGVNVGRKKDLRRLIHEEQEQQDEHNDDRQRLEALQDRRAGLPSHPLVPLRLRAAARSDIR